MTRDRLLALLRAAESTNTDPSHSPYTKRLAGAIAWLEDEKNRVAYEHFDDRLGGPWPNVGWLLR